MKTNTILIILLVIVSFYALNSYIINRNAKYFLGEKNVELKRSIDSLKEQNSRISDRILILDSVNTHNQKKISTLRDSLSKYKIHTNEKINIILNYNDDELRGFFTDRYGDNAVK